MDLVLKVAFLDRISSSHQYLKQHASTSAAPCVRSKVTLPLLFYYFYYQYYSCYYYYCIITANLKSANNNEVFMHSSVESKLINVEAQTTSVAFIDQLNNIYI